MATEDVRQATESLRSLEAQKDRTALISTFFNNLGATRFGDKTTALQLALASHALNPSFPSALKRAGSAADALKDPYSTLWAQSELAKVEPSESEAASGSTASALEPALTDPILLSSAKPLVTLDLPKPPTGTPLEAQEVTSVTVSEARELGNRPTTSTARGRST